MKTFNISFGLLLSISIGLIFSCKNETIEIETSASEMTPEMSSDVEELQMLLSDKTIALPTIKLSEELAETNQSSLIDWKNAASKQHERYDETLVPILFNEDIIIHRCYKDICGGREIISPLYSFLRVCKVHPEETLVPRVLSYSPDYRFLRKHHLERNDLMFNDSLRVDYSGLILFSELNGSIVWGELYYNGRLIHKFVRPDSLTQTMQQKPASSTENTKLRMYLSRSEEMTRGGNLFDQDGERYDFDFGCPKCGHPWNTCVCGYFAVQFPDRCAYCHLLNNNCICAHCPYCGDYKMFCTCEVCDRCQASPCICGFCPNCQKTGDLCNCGTCYNDYCTCRHCQAQRKK